MSDLVTAPPSPLELLKIPRELPPTLNSQLEDLNSTVRKLDETIRAEMHKSNSVMENMEELIEELELTALKCGIVMLSSGACSMEIFNQLFDDCMALAKNGFELDTQHEKTEVLNNIAKISTFIQNAVLKPEMQKFGEYPAALDKHLETIRSEARKASQNLEKTKPIVLPKISSIDPERRDSNWFCGWLWETYGATKRGDRAQRHELFKLMRKVAFQMTKIKSLQEQITSARNIMDINRELDGSDIAGLMNSPYYTELKNYAIFMSRIFMSDVDSNIPTMCSEYCSKFEDLVEMINRKTREMDETFDRCKIETVMALASLDAEIATNKAVFENHMKANLVAFEGVECDSCEIPEELHDAIESARMSNPGIVSHLIHMKSLWTNFRDKAEKLSSTIQQCFRIHKQIFNTAMEDTHSFAAADMDVSELERLEAQEKYLTSVIESLQIACDEQTTIAKNFDKLKSHVRKISSDQRKIEANTAKILRQRYDDEIIAKLDEEMLALREEIINLDKELAEAEIEFAKLEESEKENGNFQGFDV